MNLFERIDNLLERRGDLSARDFALKVYKKVLHFLEKNDGMDILRKGYGSMTETGRRSASITLFVDKLDVLSNFDLKGLKNIRLSYVQGSGTTGGAYDPNQKSIDLIQYTDDVQEIKRYLAMDPDEFFKEKKQAFIHEFIHHLDFTRAPGMGDKIPDRGLSSDEYYNSDHEMNAHFQQGASAVQSKIDDEFNRIFVDYLDLMMKGEVDESDVAWDLASLLLPPSEQELKGYLDRNFKGDWVRGLTPRNRRKVLKRLYDSIRQVQNRFMDFTKKEMPEVYKAIKNGSYADV